MAPRLGRLAAFLSARAAARAGPAVWPQGIAVERDIAYGPDPAQRLDLYRPERAPIAAPLMVFVHGGGWRRGDKAMPRMVGHKVAHWVPRGWCFASINYRMLPQADVLAQADDLARALAFAQGRAPAWGADPARLTLLGHSAGAHLATLLVADPDLAGAHGAAPWQATVAVDTAALDMVAVMQRPHFPFYDPVFGEDPAFWRAASPTHRLRGAPVTPVLLVGSVRRDDSLPAAHDFAARAQRFGGRVEVLAVDLGHGELNDRLGADPAYTGAVDEFIARVG